MRLNPYRVMWIMVVFDLPVLSKKQRREANNFRKHLEALGFMRLQYSVYYRHCGTRENMAAEIKRVERNLPSEGEGEYFQFYG